MPTVRMRREIFRMSWLRSCEFEECRSRLGYPSGPRAATGTQPTYLCIQPRGLAVPQDRKLQVLEDAGGGGGLVQDVQVQAGHPGIQELPALANGVGDPDFPFRLGIIPLRLQRRRKARRKLRTAEGGDTLDLGKVDDGKNSGDQGGSDARLPVPAPEREEIPVVVEELRDHHVGPGLDLALEIGKIRLGTRGFLVGLRVPRHADPEVGKLAADQGHQLVGERRPAVHRDKAGLPPRRVAPQRDEIFDALGGCPPEPGAEILVGGSHARQVGRRVDAEPLPDHHGQIQGLLAGGAARPERARDEGRPKGRQGFHRGEQRFLTGRGLWREDLEGQTEFPCSVGLAELHPVHPFTRLSSPSPVSFENEMVFTPLPLPGARSITDIRDPDTLKMWLTFSYQGNPGAPFSRSGPPRLSATPPTQRVPDGVPGSRLSAPDVCASQDSSAGGPRL